VLHAQASVRSIYIVFDGRRNAREYQTTIMSDLSDEHWRQLDERGCQRRQREHTRPGPHVEQGARREVLEKRPTWRASTP